MKHFTVKLLSKSGAYIRNTTKLFIICFHYVLYILTPALNENNLIFFLFIAQKRKQNTRFYSGE